VGTFKVEKFITTDGYKFLLPVENGSHPRQTATEKLIRAYTRRVCAISRSCATPCRQVCLPRKSGSMPLSAFSPARASTAWYALCEVGGAVLRCGDQTLGRDFTNGLQRRLHAEATQWCSAHELRQLHHDLPAVQLKRSNFVRAPPWSACHGQTGFQHPSRARRPRCKWRASLSCDGLARAGHQQLPRG